MGDLGAKPLRIGVLCNGLRLSAWQAECLKGVLSSGAAEIALFVINDEAPRVPQSFLPKLLRNLTNGLLLWRIYERLVLKRTVSTAIVDLPAEFASIPQLRCNPVKVGRFRQAFDPQAIAALREFDLDVLLRFGFGILTGDVLGAARHGIWSYHHGDPEQFRGAPPGFWEIHEGSPVTGVVLQQLTESLDGGVILRSGWFKTIGSSYRRSLDRIFFGSAHFVAASLKDFHRDPQRFDRAGPLQQPGPIYRYPRNGAMLRFFTRIVRNWVGDQFRSFFRHQQWTLGLIRMPISELFARAATGLHHVGDVQWFPERRGRFLADPMGLAHDGQLVILAEEFDWRTGRGHVASIAHLDEPSSNPLDAIRTEHHLSYPYLVEEAGELFCIPECTESGRVALYRLDPQADQWVQHSILLGDVAAVDPTLFKHEGRWWLFFTSPDGGGNEILQAWHAETLFGEWKEHANNPIKVDVRSARPAGPLFEHEGHLIRPAQDCSRRYGGSVVFNHIVKLSPEEFVEESIARIDPDPLGPYPAGLHTACGIGAWTVIDGARYRFVLSELRRALFRKIRLGGRN